MPDRILLASVPPPMASNAMVAPVAFRAAMRSAVNVSADESHTYAAPAAPSSSAWAGERTMLTSGMLSSRHSLLSIWPRLEAAAVWTSAVCPSIRMVSTIPSTVIGLTNEDAPSAAVAPAGSSRQAAAGTVRYCAYMAPPATATSLPSSAWAAGEGPAATTVPAPSLPAGSDCPTRAAAARAAAAASGAAMTGRSGEPSVMASAMSAPANSSPRSEGLIGAASIRMTTWCGSGAATSTSASDSSTVWDAVTSVRSCSPCPGT